jgi:phosphoribosylcarboxyaminoimidazole (NCAIR) mutase
MRKIGIMIGSESDLPQCHDGLRFLAKAEEEGLCRVIVFITSSIHRNTEDVLKFLRDYTDENENGDGPYDKVNIWIVGAGWANHLTGMVDSYLRYNRKNYARVIGIVFDAKNEEKNLAAFLSIEQVPGHQVIFDRKDFFGPAGFLNACRLAAIGGFTGGIVLKDPKPTKVRSLYEAIIDTNQEY